MHPLWACLQRRFRRSVGTNARVEMIQPDAEKSVFLPHREGGFPELKADVLHLLCDVDSLAALRSDVSFPVEASKNRQRGDHDDQTALPIVPLPQKPQGDQRKRH